MILQQFPLLDMNKRFLVALYYEFCVFNFITDEFLPSATGGIDDLRRFVYMQSRNVRSCA